MRFISIILLLPCFIIISACAARHQTYHEPSRSAPHATIHGQGPTLFFKGTITQITKVDGMDRGMIWSANSNIRLSPGPHSIDAFAVIRQKALRDGKSAEAKLKFTANAGQNYKLVAKMQGEKIVFWIADSKGSVVSKKVAIEQLPEAAHLVDVPELPKR